MRFATVLAVALAMGCSSGESSTDELPRADTGGADIAVDTGATSDGLTFDVSAEAGPVTYPVRKLPGLKSITYYERSGGTAPTAYTFTVDGPEMTARIPTRSDSAHDIKGVTSEFYDVYYSNAAGDFELDGRYLTISGVFEYALPAGGGLNLAEIVLNFDGDKKAAAEQINRVEAARAELKKSHAFMLLDMRYVLTPDQWTRLGAIHQANEKAKASGQTK